MITLGIAVGRVVSMTVWREGEALADGFLVLGVDVGAFADVDGDGLGGVGELEGHRLRLAQAGPAAFGLGRFGVALHVVGELDPDEGEVALVASGLSLAGASSRRRRAAVTI